MNPQFPECELAAQFDKIIPYIKKRRLLSVFFYIIFVLYFSLPFLNMPLLEYKSFRTTSLMEQRAIEHYMLFYPRQSWADYDEVNPKLYQAILSMEDGAFLMHKGIDWEEMEKSIRTNKRRKRAARGGSTVTMQLAKNLYLRTDKNLFRKGKEFLLATRLEKEVTKKAIITNYVNAAEWGDGIFGISAAAEEYFNKTPDKLTTVECAKLAAVIPSPLRHAPNKSSRYLSRRSSIILGRMNDVILPKDWK
jgi:monofunctional biosynthetic peptidoglycan transglycosylase